MFYQPMKEIGDWRKLLADPAKHWRNGFSAKCLATAWQPAAGFAQAFQSILAQSDKPVFRELRFLMGFPEHKVPLPGGSRSSQSDIFILASSATELVTIVVEGKASEAFGPTVSEWRAEASSGKQERLAFLREILQLGDKPLDGVRYQLLHRTASAIIEARRFAAKTALFLVHSFADAPESYSDFAAFVSLYGTAARKDGIFGPVTLGATGLYFCWLNDKAA
jgi:hypothetical protein